jgi:photosystem II stability/assembly factor-like uncharacterized protein
MLVTRSLFAALLVSIVAVPANALTVDPAQYQEMHWRSVGPFRGGRVLAVTGVAGDAKRFYFGAVNGGVWRTDDAGRTWNPIFDSEKVGSIGAIATAPSAPDIIYVGSGESDMRSDISQGIGMFRSADSGAHWSAIGLSDTQQIARILVDPRDANTLLVAALGHPYGPNAERGVFRSTDGGRTWAKTLFRDADTGAIDLAFEPGNPDLVYAALWQTRRPPWSVYPPSSGPGSGLYKSADGGRTWRQLTGNGLPAAPKRIGLATTPARPERVYALIDGDEGGLYRSDDHGAHFTKVTGDKRIFSRGWYFGEITADPKNADRVWVQNTVMLRSDDGGVNFAPIKGDPTGDDFHAQWIDPANPDQRILGVDQGALVTVNGGKTWSSWFNQPTGQFYHVATDNRFPYRIYGAQQDSGAAAVSSRSDSKDDGINISHFHEVTAGGESDEIAPDPRDPDTVFGGRVDKLDLRSGQSRNVDPTLAYPDDYRAEWTLPLTFGKRDHSLYFANQRVFRTKDNGEHWEPISPDLTRPTLTIPPNLDALTAAGSDTKGPRRGIVFDIATSPIVDGMIWVGTDDGFVWRTRDGGGHWTNVTPASLSPWSKVGIVEPSHFAADGAYVAVDRHRLDDQKPYLYRTRDGGRSWQGITRGLPVDGGPNSLNVVREDPVQRGLLFAGTERGAFVSFDDGDRWQPLSSGLPTTSVRDITIHDNDLVIATHGRGFYVMDGIGPLRELAAGAGSATRLYAPSPAIRINAPGFTGTPMPKDEPMAANPPFGAAIDYALASAPRGPVEIAILDAKGVQVDRFSSTDPVKPIDLSKIEVAPEWVVSRKPPAATAGHHRFVWDLHYARPPGIEGERASGVWAPPGHYMVELKVDGQILRRPLELRADPRVNNSAAAFDAQFLLARKVEADRVRARIILADAKAHATPLDPRRAAILNGSDPDQPTSPTGVVGISARLDKLANAVDGADATPSPDSMKAYALLHSALDSAESRWRMLR